VAQSLHFPVPIHSNKGRARVMRETKDGPPNVTARVAVEEASTLGWERYVGRSGRIIGMKTGQRQATAV
jgi:transketolase